MGSSILTSDGYDQALEALFDSLRNDSIMVELLRWEVAEGNHITERTSRLRELDCNSIADRYADALEKYEVDVVAISALIVAGVYFLILHKDRSTFAGIDINQPEGRERIAEAFRQLSRMIFGDGEEKEEKNGSQEPCNVEALTAALRAEGLDDSAIDRCLSALSSE